MSQPYKIVNASEAQQGDELYWPNGIPGFPGHWVKWHVVLVTKNTIRIRHGRAGAYIKTDCSIKKMRKKGVPQRICILLPEEEVQP